MHSLITHNTLNPSRHAHGCTVSTATNAFSVAVGEGAALHPPLRRHPFVDDAVHAST